MTAIGTPLVGDEIAALADLLPTGVHAASLDPAHADRALLCPAEHDLVPSGDPSRRRQFIAGRACAHAAMARLGASGPVLTRSDGAPAWPPGLRGSITHKDGLALAVVGRATDVEGLGVDLEPARALPEAARDAVLTDAERRRLGAHRQVEERLVFSAKEAYYKWFRSIGRRGAAGFLDVEVEADVATHELRFHPRDPRRWPTPQGRFVRGPTWLVTLAWSLP